MRRRGAVIELYVTCTDMMIEITIKVVPLTRIQISPFRPV